MSAAETLRQAATLMRQRAAANTDQPWKAAPHSRTRRCMTVQSGSLFLAYYVQPQAAEHIASWHPAVALAVADWLDLVARILDDGFSPNAETSAALRVARTYLGVTEDAP